MCKHRKKTKKTNMNYSYQLAMFIGILIVIFFTSLSYGVANPVISATMVADCDAMKYNGQYYLIGLGTNGRMYTSNNLVNWTLSPAAVVGLPSWGSGNASDIHANDLIYFNGTFYMYVQHNNRISLATSNGPMGPYTYPGNDYMIPQSPDDYNAIDPEYFRDIDGDEYFYYVAFPPHSNHNAVGNNVIHGQDMNDPATLTGDPAEIVWVSQGWEQRTGAINEGPAVFKHHDQYYMLYAANESYVPNTSPTQYGPWYQVGCIQSDHPGGFNIHDKYPDPVLAHTDIDVNGVTWEILCLGQPWVVDGLNGFEKWLGYFSVNTHPNYRDGLKRQCIDRILFLGDELYVDGPTTVNGPILPDEDRGYHPNPAEPQYHGIFDDTSLSDWTAYSGSWDVNTTYNELRQNNSSGTAWLELNRPEATHYLFEANIDTRGATGDRCALRVYYEDPDNWLNVGMDRDDNSWYYEMERDGVRDTQRFDIYSGFNWNVYHKIRVERNGKNFYVLFDDMIPTGFNGKIATTDFNEPSKVGLYTIGSSAAFDGVIYTVGWDEWDERVQGWTPMVGNGNNWSMGSGVSQTVRSQHIDFALKGDRIEHFEFSAQLHDTLGTDTGLYGIGLYQDGSHWLVFAIDRFNTAGNMDTLKAIGQIGGQDIPNLPVDVNIPGNAAHNLRMVKLADEVIVFVDGQQMMTVDESFGLAQAAVATYDITARFDDICVYQLSGGRNARSGGRHGYDTYEPDNNSSQAKEISVFPMMLPQIHDIYPAGDRDWVKFELTEPSNVLIETDGPDGGNTVLRLYDSSFSILDKDINDGRDKYSLIEASLNPGIYYVKINDLGYNDEIIGYTISVTTCEDFYEPDDSYNEASEIIVDGEPQIHDISPIGDKDWVWFELTEPANVRIETTGLEGGNTILWLYDSSLSRIDRDFNSGEGKYSLIKTSLNPGVYYVKVGESGNNAEILGYTISVKNYYDDDDELPGINEGEVQIRSIYPIGDVDEVGFLNYDVGIYRFETDGPSGGDTEMWVRDDDNVLIYDDNSGTGNYSMIETYIGEGMANVIIQENGNDELIENYTLALTLALDDYEPDDSYQDARPIEVDGPAQIHSSNPSNNDDWVWFELTETTDIRIEIVGTPAPAGSHVGTWLYDSGVSPVTYGSEDNPIEETLEAGTYYIKTWGYVEGGDNLVAEYILKVSSQ